MRVLVVEGRAEIRSRMVTALERAGYHTCASPNGEQALALAALCLPHLVVIDAAIDGLVAVIGALRALGVEVVAVAPEAQAAKMRDLGAARTLAKPFRVEQLLAAVSGRAATGEGGSSG